MLGIAAAQQLAPRLAPDLPFIAILLAAIALCLIALLCCSPRRALVWAGLPLFCCTGALHGWQALHAPAGPERVAAALTERSKVTVQGRVLDMVSGDGSLSRCTVGVTGLLIHGVDERFRPLSGKVALRMRGKMPGTVQAGDLILAMGWAERPRVEAFFVQAQDFDAILWLSAPAALKLLPEKAPGPVQGLRFAAERLRQRMARFLEARLEPEVAAVYQALLVGAQQSLSPAMLELFRNSGCLHILAISGMHVGLVTAMAAALAYGLLRRSSRILLSGHARMLALGLSMPLILFYACLAGLNVPVVRALITTLLALAALFLYRRRIQLHLVAGAALVVLALQPLALFRASFQLSFAAVAALVLILPRLPCLQPPEGAEDPAELPGPGLMSCRRICSGLRRTGLSLLMVSVAATLGTAPFMLYHFNRLSLVGPLMNLAIEPLLCLWALPCGLAGLALFLLLPGLPWPALMALRLGGWGIKTALLLLEAATRIPLASCWTITPHPLEIIVYFIAVALWFRLLPGGRLRRAVAAVLSCGLLLSFTASLWLHPGKRELRVSYIDVGQGASALVSLPDGRHLLIDCGGYRQAGYEVGSRRVAPFLWRRRIWRLDAALASHADSDHYSGLPFVLARFRPQVLYVNVSERPEAAYRAMLAQARAAGIAVRQIAGREILAAGPDFVLEAFGLEAREARQVSENDRSLLVRLARGRRAFLFPGDIAAARERLLLRDLPPALLRADVLMAGHHGSGGSTTPPFLRAVAPRAIVVSASAAKKGTHPASSHLESWQQQGILVFATAESGSIIARTDGERLCLESGGRQQCLE